MLVLAKMNMSEVCWWSRPQELSSSSSLGSTFVGLWVPQTLERFELWVRAEISTCPACLLVILLSLARQAQRDKETHRFILVWATLRCNTLLQRFGGLHRRAEDELVEWMNWPQEVRCS